MAINSKAPISTDKAISSYKGRKGSASPEAAVMASKCQAGAGRGLARHVQGKRLLYQRRGGVGTGQVGACIEPTTRNYF